MYKYFFLIILFVSCDDSKEDKIYQLITNNGNIIENDVIKIYECEKHTSYKNLIIDGLQNLSFKSKDEKKIQSFLTNQLFLIENIYCNECFKAIEESKDLKVIEMLDKYNDRGDRIKLMLKICELDSINYIFEEQLKLSEELFKIEFVRKRFESSLKESEKKEYFSILEKSIIKIFKEKYLKK